MSITFLVPIKNSEYINNNKNFLAILNRTLAYLQTVHESKTIIVCDKHLKESHLQKFDCLAVDSTQFGYGDPDKEFKVYLGCQKWLNSGSTSHLMIVDMDDLVLAKIRSLELKENENLVFMSGYQKIFNRLFLYSSMFYYHCGSSFIFGRKYIERKMKEYDYKNKWMFHHDHNLEEFTHCYTPCVIQVPWNGENVWWKKKRLRDYLKWFFAK